MHSLIVSSSSNYFATFPEPKTGRVINDVDAPTFEVCAKYMYLGECDDELSNDNVASILYASDILQIDGLKLKCMEYLKDNLDHTNYEQVVQFATEQFGNPQLKMHVSGCLLPYSHVLLIVYTPNIIL